MLRKTIQLLFGMLCGYLYIIWMPETFPFAFSRFVAALIVDPLQFFAATVAFIVGFMNIASLIKGGIEKTMELKKNADFNKLELLIAYCVPIAFVLFLQFDIFLTLLFFCFAFVYGMISIDFK